MDKNNDRIDHYEFTSGLIHITRLLFKNIRWIGGIVLGVMIITAVIVLLIPNKYRSDASILPSGKQDNLSALKMLAGFGGVGFEADENSSALFPEILKSNQVRDAVLAKEYTLGSGPDKEVLTLKEYFDDDKPERLRNSLGSITDIETEPGTGIIYLSVTTRDPSFSKQILTETLAELENYNLNIRRSQAKDSERYLERELKGRAAMLEESEKKLEEFQNANRDWYGTNDPGILMTLAQFKRDIEINSQTYLLLREQYEMARLNAQKDVPIVRILDFPSLPTLKSSPLRTITVIMAGMISFIIVFGFFIISDAFKKATNQSSRDSLGSLGDDLARAFPVINRLLIKRKAVSTSEDTQYSE